MFKKLAVFSVVTLLLALGVFGLVKTTHAQEIAVVESPAVQVVTQEEASFEYQNSFQYGERNGDSEPIMTQTRTQTQLRELQDGECTGDGEQQQLRLNIGAGQQGEMRQQRLHLADGTCNGDCVPLRRGGQGN